MDDALTIERLSEEHATVRVTGGTPLEPGDRVRVLPNHSCVVSNLVDVVRLVERGDPARGRAMGRAGRLRVEAQFSWASVAERTRDVYADAIDDFARAEG